jgi:hypothetical protein
MAIMRILVANEPQAYRDVVAMAIRVFRPQMEVIVVEPEDLDREIVHRDPTLVVCSTLTEIVETRMFAWILLYPDGKTRAEISLSGQRTSLGDIELTLLLSTVDEAKVLAGIN